VLPSRALLRLCVALLGFAQRTGLVRLFAPLLGARGAALRHMPAVPPRAERRPLEPRIPAQGAREGAVAMLAGCVMPELYGRVNRATARCLAAAGLEVRSAPEHVCCGALHAHNGDLAGARALARPSFYLDPVRIVDGHARRRTPATPSIAHYFALARQLDDIGAGATLPESERPVEGAAAWRARFAKHERMRERTLAWAAAHGIEPLPERRFASPTVSCLKADGLDVPRLIAAAKARGHEIGNGYGKLKNETFRIGHMGDHGEDDLEALLAALDEALPEARGAG
jgi:hypothetical protein